MWIHLDRIEITEILAVIEDGPLARRLQAPVDPDTNAFVSAAQTSDDLERRDALWAIEALQDEPLPLFAAAAAREERAVAEQQEPEVVLRQMNEGHKVVADYAHVALNRPGFTGDRLV